jgi:hypothetical protein
MKTCSICKITKSFDEFHKNGNYLYSKCKNCKKQYYSTNREHSLIYFKNYNDNRDIEKRKKWAQERYKDRHQNDPKFRIKINLRTRIRDALNGTAKSSTTKDLLGCDIGSYKKYLEAKFQNGMNWTNYGEWHIDHIVPCAKFDLTNPEEQKKCFHYTNTQPLWAKDNFSKGSK